jgi:hypothetical protein
MICLSPHFAEKQRQVKWPLDLLLGFAIELLLKAYLRDRGWTDKQVFQAKHHIEKLHGASAAEGLPSLHPQLASVVEKLAGPHSRSETRYAPTDATFQLFDVWDAIWAIAALEEHVGKELKAVEAVQGAK